MALAKLGLLGLLGYGVYNYLHRSGAAARRSRTHDGLTAIYSTREQVDLAIEHLVQEHGVDRSVIFVEPVEDGNTSGAQISGGDAPSGGEGSRIRRDAPLNGAIRLTVGASEHELALLRGALEQVGATSVEAA